jgi:signal transduction histidine kinase
MGHYLKNGLGVVGGRAELLRMHLDRGNLDGALKGVDVILGQMERMKALSDELRNLHKRA